MFKYTFTLLVCAVLTLPLMAQNDSLNMEKLFQWDDDELVGSYNDCWGYTDPAGNEYAILGSTQHIFFFNITDPENTTLVRKFSNGDPDLVGGVDIDNTTWRDFKTYEEKAYSCADQVSSNEGLIVFDLSELPDTVTVDTQITSFFTKSHNIYIDETSGYLYTAGARVNNTFHDVFVLDLNTDPISLVADVSIDGGKLHDIHVVNDTAYCNSESEMYVIDFTDPANPSTIGSLDSYTNSGYNHSGWRTADGKHYVFCDETPARKVKILDVTDPANLSNSEITDQFFSNLVNEDATNPASMAHNPFIKDNLVYVAYYNDGVQVFDISDPQNVVRDGYYDTFDNANYNNRYDGVWGVYPFFASGSIIASDGDNGLFVLRMTNGPLPVDLISFSVKQQKDKVKLNWSTASERNSAVFEVERSYDGEKFSTIKTVKANSNSTERIDYVTFDEAPMPGGNYYRLKQVDLDGKIEYSEIQFVAFESNTISVSPTYINADQKVKIIFEKETKALSIDLINTNGQVLKTYVFNDLEGSVYEIPTDDLQNGLYVFRIQHDESVTAKKIMVAR